MGVPNVFLFIFYLFFDLLMKYTVIYLFIFQAVEHDSTLENTPSLSLQSLTEEEKV